MNIELIERMESNPNLDENLAYDIEKLIKKQDKSGVKRLLKYFPGLDLSRFPGPWQGGSHRMAEKYTPLMYAAKLFKSGIFDFLLRLGLDVNIVNPYQKTNLLGFLLKEAKYDDRTLYEDTSMFAIDLLRSERGLDWYDEYETEDEEPQVPAYQVGRNSYKIRRAMPRASYMRNHVDICIPSEPLENQPLMILLNNYIRTREKVRMGQLEEKHLLKLLHVLSIILQVQLQRNEPESAQILMSIFCDKNNLPHDLYMQNFLGQEILYLMTHGRKVYTELYDFSRFIQDDTTKSIYEILHGEDRRNVVMTAWRHSSEESPFTSLPEDLIAHIAKQSFETDAYDPQWTLAKKSQQEPRFPWFNETGYPANVRP